MLLSGAVMSNTHCFIAFVFFLFVFEEAVSNTQQCHLAQVCVADVNNDDCTSGQVYVPNTAIEGCCPGCGVPPDDGTGGVVMPGCQSSYDCLPNGKYAPVQCKGDVFTGRCFCYDEDGKRIFGQMWRSDAADMTCACSRRRAELEKSGRIVTLHCSSSGDYEPLQCDEGLCWCAEPSTGQPTTPPLPESDMKHLPCYNLARNGEQYLRRCESIVYATAMIHKEQSEHGTFFLGNPTTFCDYDGSYGPYQIQNGIAYCTGRDGEILGAWQVMASEMSDMNCHCARDSMMYFPEKGLTVTEVCEGNGNYRPNQNAGDIYYCVDSDGYPTTEMLESWPPGNCANPL